METQSVLVMNISIFKAYLPILNPINYLSCFFNFYLWIWQRFLLLLIYNSTVYSVLQVSQKEQSLVAGPGIKSQCVMFIFKLVFMFAFLGMIVLLVIAVLFSSWVHNNSDSVTDYKSLYTYNWIPIKFPVICF